MTQSQIILDMLRRGPVTVQDAEAAGIHRLAARIFDLVAEGHCIDSETVVVPTRHGTPARIARYTLRTVPKWAGDAPRDLLNPSHHSPTNTVHNVSLFGV